MFNNYESKVAGVPQAEALISDTSFSAGVAEQHRSTKQILRLTGKSFSQAEWFAPKFSEGLAKAGYSEAAPIDMSGSGMVVMPDEIPQLGEKEYRHANRDLYKKHEQEIIEAGGMSLEDLDKMYADEVREAQKDIDMTGQRASTAAEIMGSLSGGFRIMVEDPAQLATLPAGGVYRGGSVVAFALKEAMLQGAISAETEKLIIEANRELLEEQGITDYDEMYNILIAGGAGMVFGGSLGGLGAKIEQNTVNAFIKGLNGKTLEDLDAADIVQIDRLMKRNWKFDEGQRRTIRVARHKKDIAETNFKGEDANGQAAASGSMEAMERGAQGGAKEGDSAKIDAATGRVEYDPASAVLERITSLQDRLDNMRYKRSPRRMQMEVELEEARAELSELSQRMDEASDATEMKELTGRKLNRAEAEYDSIRAQTEQARDRILQAEAEGRRISKSQGDHLVNMEKLEAKYKAKRDEARVNAKAAKERAAKADKSRAEAEAEINRQYNDGRSLKKINKDTNGFQWKKRTAEKGQKLREPQDVVSTNREGTAKAEPKKVEPRDDGAPDEAVEKSVDDRYQDMKERVARSSGEAAELFNETLDEVEYHDRMGKGINSIQGCIGGGE